MRSVTQRGERRQITSRRSRVRAGRDPRRTSPRDRGPDDRRGALLAPGQRHGDQRRRARPRRAHSRGRSDERGLRPGRRAPRRPASADERREPRRHQPGLPPGRHGHRAAGRPRPGRELQPGAGAVLGRDGRARGARAWPERHARGRRQPRARPAQRAQLRVPVRGPAAQRRARRRGDRRDPGRGRDLDHQAPLAELQRDQPPLARRAHRARRAPRVRPARVRDRHRARAARLGHDGLQQGQRRLRRRQSGPARGDPQGRVGLPRLGHVRLGRDAHVGLRAGGARPGVGRADRRADVGRRVLHRAAAQGVRRGRAAAGAPVGDGAAHPALDIRDRHRCVGSGARGRSRRASRHRPRGRPAGHRAARERRHPAARDRHERADRGHRRLRRARRARRHRLERGHAARRLRGRGAYRRPRDHGQRAQPLPPAVVADGGARPAAARGRDRVRPRG